MIRLRLSSLVTGLLLLLAVGCSVRDAACGGAVKREPVILESDRAAMAGIEAARVEIVVLGDSLTAGLGLLALEAFPALLQLKFDDDGYQRIDVINRGVSGDTTTNGLNRLDWVLTPDVRILVVALGANDALRGLPPAQTRQNLEQIIEAAQQRGALVLLAGMEAPPNLGEQFQTEFRAIYPALAAKYNARLLPFLLEGIAGLPHLNQADGMHPTAVGQQMIADMLYPLLQPMADDVLSR